MDLANIDSINLTMMCVLCRTKTASFENLMIAVIVSGNAEDMLAKLKKYGLFNHFGGAVRIISAIMTAIQPLAS